MCPIASSGAASVTGHGRRTTAVTKVAGRTSRGYRERQAPRPPGRLAPRQPTLGHLGVGHGHAGGQRGYFPDAADAGETPEHRRQLAGVYDSGTLGCPGQRDV